jgi:hypothetical protein
MDRERSPFADLWTHDRDRGQNRFEHVVGAGKREP